MQRIEVSFEDAFLPRVAAEVLKQAGTSSGRLLACGNVVVVLPGRRAGRRLLELLAERAQEERRLLVPPRVCTPQQFCMLICELCGMGGIATPLEQLAAWVHACAAQPSLLRAVCAADESTTPRNGEQLFALARHFDSVYGALAGERLDFRDAAEHLPPESLTRTRLLALQELSDVMRSVLDGRGLRTVQDALEAALTTLEKRHPPALNSIHQVIIAGVVDQFAQFTACVRALSARVTIMTYGPPGAGWFDETGALRWREELTFEKFDTHVDKIVCADTAAAQARAVVEWLRTAGRGYAVTDVVIGVPDAEVSRALRAALVLEGVEAHDAVGTPFGESILGVLLRAVREFIDDPTWVAALHLVRHPVVEQYLRQRLSGAPLSAAQYGRLLLQIERYVSDHLVQVVTRERPPAQDAEVEKAVAELTELLIAILARFEGEKSANDWLSVLNSCLAEWHTEIDKEDALITRDEEALRAWADLSAHVQEARIPLPGTVSAVTALGQLLTLAHEIALAPPRTGPAVDLVGWLELALDDAPVVAVTGMNEGVLSESVVSDAFLPDSLRERLGIACNARRLMRDRYILRTIVNTGKRFLLTCGRAAGTGDPLRISRVLCDMTPSVLADLLLRFYGRGSAQAAFTPSDVVSEAPGAPSVPLTIQPPSDTGLELRVESLNVTEFATYLACPYRFYLRRVVGEPPSPLGMELSPVQFGSLVHAVLAAFGRSSLRGDTDARTITDFLMAELEREASRTFGHTRSLALDVQLAACRQRLAAFAEKQAQRAQEGFEIVGVEMGDRFDFMLEGVKIRMRIDRIDRRGSEVHIVDYKTGQMQPPEQHARRGDEWVDLQLPLYWYGVVRSGAFASCDVKVGYFCLPGATVETAVRLAAWREGDGVYDAAVECARRVVIQIRAQEFRRTDDVRQCEDCLYRAVCHRG